MSFLKKLSFRLETTSFICFQGLVLKHKYTVCLLVEELPGGRAQLAVRLFGVDTQVDFTQGDKVVDLLLDFLCLPHS